MTPQDKIDKLNALLLSLEKIGERRKELMIEKVLAEAALQDKEDIVRAEALESSMAISKIPHHLKDHTQKERKTLHEKESNYRVKNMEWEQSVEILNGIKFSIRMDEMMANNSNL